MATHIDDLFTLEKCRPVNFFYRLPFDIRKKYIDFWYKEMLSDEVLMWVQEKHWIEHYMYDISPEKFREKIIKYSDDVDYFTFYEYFDLLQPTIETIVNGCELYDEYPEYLI